MAFLSEFLSGSPEAGMPIPLRSDDLPLLEKNRIFIFFLPHQLLTENETWSIMYKNQNV